MKRKMWEPQRVRTRRVSVEKMRQILKDPTIKGYNIVDDVPHLCYVIVAYRVEAGRITLSYLAEIGYEKLSISGSINWGAGMTNIWELREKLSKQIAEIMTNHVKELAKHEIPG